MRRALCSILLALATVSAGIPASAQNVSKFPRIGVLVNGSPDAALTIVALDALRKSFAALGYVDGTTIAFEPRFASGQLGRHPELAADLVQANVDVILALGGPAASAAKNATATIPVVFSIVTDPVALGLVKSLAKSGTNAIGVTSLDPAQANAQFALIRQLIPDVKRVAIVSDAAIPGADASGLAPIDRDNLAAARALGIEARVVKLKSQDPNLEEAFAAMATDGTQAVLALEVPVALLHRKRIAELAAARRLPSVFPGGTADAGGLLTYGTSVADTWPRMPVLVDTILKGANPANLAVEVLTRRELIVNAKAAQAIGMSIPVEILQRADRTID